MLRNISLKIPYKGCPGQEVRINGLFHPLIKVRRGDITHLDPNLLPKLPVRDIQVARISPFQQAEIVPKKSCQADCSPASAARRMDFDVEEYLFFCLTDQAQYSFNTWKLLTI